MSRLWLIRVHSLSNMKVLRLSADIMYEGRSINKLQNGAIPLILKIGKIRNIRFVGNLILKIHKFFFDDDDIIVTSSVHLCIIFSTSFLS